MPPLTPICGVVLVLLCLATGQIPKWHTGTSADRFREILKYKTEMLLGLQMAISSVRPTNSRLADAVFMELKSLRDPTNGVRDFGVDFSVTVADAVIPKAFRQGITPGAPKESLDPSTGGVRAVSTSGMTELTFCENPRTRYLTDRPRPDSFGWPCPGGGSAVGAVDLAGKNCFVIYLPRDPVGLLRNKLRMLEYVQNVCYQAQVLIPIDLTELSSCIMAGYPDDVFNRFVLEEEGVATIHTHLKGVAVFPTYTEAPDYGFRSEDGHVGILKHVPPLTTLPRHPLEPVMRIAAFAAVE